MIERYDIYIIPNGVFKSCYTPVMITPIMIAIVLLNRSAVSLTVNFIYETFLYYTAENVFKKKVNG